MAMLNVDAQMTVDVLIQNLRIKHLAGYVHIQKLAGYVQRCRTDSSEPHLTYAAFFCDGLMRKHDQPSTCRPQHGDLVEESA